MPRTRLLILPTLLLAALLLAGRQPEPVAAQLPPHESGIAAGGAAPFVCSVPSFAGPVNYAAGAAPAGVALGDFNRDGNPDLVTSNQNANTVV